MIFFKCSDSLFRSGSTISSWKASAAWGPKKVKAENPKSCNFLRFHYDLPFSVGPNIFFLGAAEGWSLGLGAAEAFLGLGWSELSPRISQYLLHWCKTLNWSMKDVAQFPLNPLYLQQKATLSHPSQSDNVHLQYSS